MMTRSDPVRVAQDGGYRVVKGGAYAEVPDPRALTPGARSAPAPGFGP